MGCSASLPHHVPGSTDTYTFLEHSKMGAAEIRHGDSSKKEAAPPETVFRKALFQSNVTVIQKLAGDRTVETIKITDPDCSSVHHVVTARMNDKKLGKNVLVSSATGHYLMVFKGTKAIQSGTMYIHELPSADAQPENKHDGHAKLISMTAEGVQLYDSPDKDASALAATAKFMSFEAGFKAEVLSGDGVGLHLALLVGAHLLVMTQLYYRPAEKRALGPDGSLGSLMLAGAAFSTNDDIRGGANKRLQFGHDSVAFHGCMAWANGSGAGAYAANYDSKAGFIDKRRNVTVVVNKKDGEPLGVQYAAETGRSFTGGLTIRNVTEGSLAALSGILPKDVLVSINGEPVTSAKIGEPGTKTIVVQRGAQPGLMEKTVRTLILA